jgi:hypothetical protein
LSQTVLKRDLFALACAVLLVGCERPLPPARLTSTVADSGGVTVITLDRSLADVALGAAGSANDTATLLFVVDSMTHPVAVAFLPTGSTAVLDRADRVVTLLDSTGFAIRSLGRAGNGPGELEVPAGLISLGADLVLLQSHPVNTLVRFSDAGITSVAPPIPGDWSGWFWQRPNIALEFPVQSAPELWSRRLRALDDSTFVAYVGPVDQDTSRGAGGLLLRFDRDLELMDTIVAFPVTHRELRPATDRRGAPQLFQQVWAPRVVWGVGDGKLAIGQSDEGRVTVAGGAGSSSWTIQWPIAALPVTEEDRGALGERIVNATIAASPEAAANAAAMSRSERKEMVAQFMATYDLAAIRPEVTALFLSEGCLWLAGFDATDDADGTAHEWVVIDLERPSTAPRVVTIGNEGERVVAIGRGKAATIRLEEDGFRRVRVYRVPACGNS